MASAPVRARAKPMRRTRALAGLNVVPVLTYVILFVYVDSIYIYIHVYIYKDRD